MRYGSVCSGIGAPEYAWSKLGWECEWASEIEPFARAVYAHHYPSVPLHGDFTRMTNDEAKPVDLLVGGTPCQGFSTAGSRGGLDDARSNLALGFLKLAGRIRPEWIVWENVPGCLSTNGGRDFGAFLGSLAKLGYSFAYRVLDAQYFGVPQRRRRVFLVANLRDWRRAAAVLFERDCLSRNPAPGGKSRERTAPSLEARANAGGAGWGTDFMVDGGLAVGFDSKGIGADATDDLSPTLRSRDCLSKPGGGLAVAISCANVSPTLVKDAAGVARTGNERTEADFLVATQTQVRRLTPTECERLMAFPDHYTAIEYRGKPAADGPRYRALGNSIVTNCLTWIGERIDKVRALG